MFVRIYRRKIFQTLSLKVSDLVSQDGLFIITTTSCGACILAYPELNELTKDSLFEKVNFVALYSDSFQKINTYKLSSGYERFGELESPWAIFSSDELVRKFNSNYDFDGWPYVFIKKDGEIVYEKYGIEIPQIKEQLAKLQTLKIQVESIIVYQKSQPEDKIKQVLS